MVGVFMAGGGGGEVFLGEIACFWRIGVFLLVGSSSSWLALGGVSLDLLNLLLDWVFLVGRVFLAVARVLLDGMAVVWRIGFLYA